jgi:hypothetical protein
MVQAADVASSRPAHHTDKVRAVAFGQLPDGRTLLAAGGTSKTVQLGDFEQPPCSPAARVLAVTGTVG